MSSSDRAKEAMERQRKREQAAAARQARIDAALARVEKANKAKRR